jgi:hypothetical protein
LISTKAHAPWVRCPPIAQRRIDLSQCGTSQSSELLWCLVAAARAATSVKLLKADL